MCLQVFICGSIYLCIYIFVYISICLPICLRVLLWFESCIGKTKIPRIIALNGYHNVSSFYWGLVWCDLHLKTNVWLFVCVCVCVCVCRMLCRCSAITMLLTFPYIFPKNNNFLCKHTIQSRSPSAYTLWCVPWWETRQTWTFATDVKSQHKNKTISYKQLITRISASYRVSFQNMLVKKYKLIKLKYKE